MKMEIYKIFSKKYIFLISIVGLMLQMVISGQLRTTMFEGYHKSVYQHYMSKLDGRYSDDKKDYVYGEYEKYQDLLNNEEKYENDYSTGRSGAEEYRILSDEIKTAKYRIKTLEYIVEKTDYYNHSARTAEYFYDTEIKDYMENLHLNIIAIIVILLIVIPMYTEDYYSGTIPMIRSSKNGRKELFSVRFMLTVMISCITYAVFSITEFLTRDILFNLGNMRAGLESLMMDRFLEWPEYITNLPILKIIVLLYLIYMLAAVILGIVGLIVSKLSRGNIEAFTIMGIVLVGVRIFLR